MSKRTTLRHIGEMVILLPLFFTNAAFADDSENRLNAYKGNKLIPQEVNITTINVASSESIDVAVFTPDTLSWVMSTKKDILVDKYGDVNSLEFPSGALLHNYQIGPQLWSAWDQNYGQDFLDFLSLVSRGEITGTNLTKEEADAMRQQVLDAMLSSGGYFALYEPTASYRLNAAGLNLSDMSSVVKLDNLYNLSPAEFANIKDYAHLANYSINLAEVVSGSFSGSEDLSNHNFAQMNISGVSGITATQLVNSKGWFATGSFPGVNLSSEQYATFKNTLQESLPEGESAVIRVDGVETIITR